MSTIYTRYFRVTSGPLMDKARDLEAANDVARIAVGAFVKEVGAKNSLSFRDGRLSGFVFDTPPDPGVWKTPNSFGAYWPRKNAAAGRDMLARIEALPAVVHIENAVEAVGLTPDLPVLINSRAGYRVTLCGRASLGVLFLTVPWRNVSPDEVAEYKRKKADGLQFSIEMDHLCWAPSAGMEEVKRWEVDKEIDELNARIAAMAKGVPA